MAVWVLTHALLKWLGQAGLDLDSAEQVYFAQSLQMGYGTRQPPLYTWALLALKPAQLSWAVMLELARYACLLGWLAGVQALARVCGADRAVQARVLLAHLGLLLVMWRVHDSLTHTVLAACLTTWGSVALVQAVRRPACWTLVGLAAALACLSKLNAALWCLSSFLAAWVIIVRPQRSQAGDTPAPSVAQHAWWMLAGLGVFAAVLAPYGLWWASRPSGSVALARRIVVSDEGLAWWAPVTDVVLGSLEYVALGPLALALLAWFVQRYAATSRLSAGPGQRWLAWQTALGLLLLIASLTAMKGSHFTPRWLWPVVPGVTVWLSVWALQSIDASERPRWQRATAVWLWAMPVLALLMAVARFWEPGMTAQRCRNCWTDRPAAALSAELHRRHGEQGLRLIAGDAHLAGILAEVAGPDLTWAATSPDLPAPDGFTQGMAPCIAVWLDMDKPAPAPEGLQALMVAGAQARVVSGAWPMRLAPQRAMWLQSVALPDAVCNAAAR